MTEQVRCPLCDSSDARRLGPVESRDAVALECHTCGRYAMDVLAPGSLDGDFKPKRYLLSAATRSASEAKRPVTVSAETSEQLAASVTRPSTLIEMVNRLLLFLADRAPDFWSAGPYNLKTDYPLLVLKGPQEFTYLMKVAGEMQLLEPGTGVIARLGWERIDELRRSRPNSRQAFVAMWFHESLTEAWVKGFNPGIESTGRFEALRVDGVQHNGKIDDRIVAEIRRSGLVVADFTGNRGGVYFEAGLAIGLGLPVIWTCRKDCIGEVQFDTRQYNHIIWEDVETLRDALRDRILATVVAGAV